MTVETLFSLSNLSVLPFWFLMIVLPHWRWTRRIMETLWPVVPFAVLYAFVIIPQLGSAFGSLLNPTLAGVSALLSRPEAMLAGWAHYIAFDLFVGRWAYLDSRERNLSAWLMAPVLFFILMAGPIGFLLYLVVRAIQPALGKA
jgi:hypothetical protein